jgi:hypothetical protein
LRLWTVSHHKFCITWGCLVCQVRFQSHHWTDEPSEWANQIFRGGFCRFFHRDFGNTTDRQIISTENLVS